MVDTLLNQPRTILCTPFPESAILCHCASVLKSDRDEVPDARVASSARIGLRAMGLGEKRVSCGRPRQESGLLRHATPHQARKQPKSPHQAEFPPRAPSPRAIPDGRPHTKRLSRQRCCSKRRINQPRLHLAGIGMRGVGSDGFALAEGASAENALAEGGLS